MRFTKVAAYQAQRKRWACGSQRSVARLRITFGDELFVRAAGAMQPTAKATRLAPGIANALRALEEALTDAIPFAPESDQRRFAVASTDYTSQILIPALVAALRSQAPNVSLHIFGYDKEHIPEMIDSGSIDLALGVFRNPPERAVRQRLCSERFVGLCRSNHPYLVEMRMSLEDYINSAHALVSVRRDARGEIDDILATRGLKRRIALTLPHMLALPAILENSDLVAAVPDRIARNVMRNGIATFELPVPTEPWNIEMLWSPGARGDHAHAWIRSKMLEIARSL